MNTPLAMLSYESEEDMGKHDKRKFPYVGSVEEMNRMPGADQGFSSPGGVAMALGISREGVQKMEERGNVIGYRIRGPRPWLPEWITTRDPFYGHDYVFYSVSSVREYAKKNLRPVGGPFPPAPQE